MYLSVVTPWEMEFKSALGRLDLTEPPRTLVPGQIVPGQIVPGQIVPGQIVPGQIVRHGFEVLDVTTAC